MREEGLRRLTPGYLEDISDTKTEIWTPTSPSDTTRFTIKTPTKGKKTRIVRVEVFDVSISAPVVLELYFGTATNADGANDKAIDLLKVPMAGSDATRTWARGAGPVGDKDQVLSGRKRSMVGADSLEILLEYTEER